MKNQKPKHYNNKKYSTGINAKLRTNKEKDKKPAGRWWQVSQPARNSQPKQPGTHSTVFGDWVEQSKITEAASCEEEQLEQKVKNQISRLFELLLLAS